MDIMELNDKEVVQHLSALVSEIKKRESQPIYNIFPDEGPYSRDKYPKHMEAIAATDTHDVVYFRAANRVGKSTEAGICIYSWMTGLYPEWFNGRKFDHPTTGWIVGVDYLQLRDGIQRILTKKALKPGDGGMIPRELIYKVTTKSKPSGAYLDLYVIHVPTYNKLTQEQKLDPRAVEMACSVVTFKGWEQDIENFQSSQIHWCVIDEEPPLEYYSEIRMRTMSGVIDGRPGPIFIAATPLKCYSDFVMQFENANYEEGSNKRLIVASWEDVPHISESEKKAMLEDMPPHEVEARTKGIPYLGGGMTFPVAPHHYVVDDIYRHFERRQFPPTFRYVNGIDHGSTTALVFLSKDPVSNIVYVFSELEFKDTTIPIKAYVLSNTSKAIYMSDTSINAVNEYDQIMLNKEYDNAGLTFKYPNKKLKEAMAARITTMMISGKLKISTQCIKLLRAIRSSYRDKDTGKIEKNDKDHHLDALLYAIQGIDVYAMTNSELAMMAIEQQKATLEGELFNDFDTDANTNNRWV